MFLLLENMHDKIFTMITTLRYLLKQKIELEYVLSKTREELDFLPENSREILGLLLLSLEKITLFF